MSILKLEAAFGGSWYDDPADLTWSDVTAYMGAVTQPSAQWSHGRSSAMDRTPAPGSFSTVLNSWDGAWIPDNPASPFYPDVQPGLPVRLTVGGAPQFYGFVTEIAPEHRSGNAPGGWTQITLTAVDGWARVMQAGKRLTYRDRVLTDLAGGRTLAWITASGQWLEEARSTGVHTDGSLIAQDLQQFGFGWWALAPGGLLAWDQPGAAGVLAESGGGDSSWMALLTQQGGSLAFRSTDGLSSDRFGGMLKAEYVTSGVATRLVQSATAYSGGNSPNNFVRQQASIGRPPVQLLPVSALVASGWTPSAGSMSDVDALTLPWTPRSDAFDPVTKVRTTVVDGPARALVWTSPTTGAKAVSGTFPVVAGTNYAVHAGADVGTKVRMAIRWLDSGGLTLSETNPSLALSSSSAPDVVKTDDTQQLLAPAGAVQARLVLVSQGTANIQIHSPGVYPALKTSLTNGSTPQPMWLRPARWWPQGASDHLYLYVQVPLTNPSAIGVTSSTRLWLHGEVQVDSWADGQLHSLGWNVSPGVDGQPVIWVDGVEVTASWRLSYPGRDIGWSQGGTAIPMVPQWSLGMGNASRNETNVAFTVSMVQPSLVTTAWAVIGTDRWNASPDDALVTRWHTPYGAPATVTMLGTATGTTDVLMDSLLDALAWPASQRDLDTGTVSSSVTWTDGAEGDYAQDISSLAAAERGWAGVDASGVLVWRPMRWYDPDGDGTAEAVAHLTYKREPGKITYSVGLGQSMSEDKVVNQAVVSGFGDTLTALAEDHDSQARIGIRREELNNSAWKQADVDAVAAEVLALYGRPTLLPDKVTLRAVGPDDPDLAVILALNPADVVNVTIPRAPAADLTVSALVGQISLTSDGRTLTADLSLGPCPVPAVMPPWTGPVFLGLDAQGPFVDASRAEDAPHVSLDAGGYFYDPAGSLSVAVDADGPYVLEGS